MSGYWTGTVDCSSLLTAVRPSPAGQRVYVSVAVGNEKRRTEVYKRKDDDKAQPTWAEDFML